MTRKTNIFKSKRFARIARRVSTVLAAVVAMSCVATSAVDNVDAGSAAAVKPGDSVNAVTVSQPDFPLADYGNGSHYNTKNGGACDPHPGTLGDTCKTYGGAWQCAGFARYVFDVYSHRSSWQDIAGDTNSTTRYYGSDAEKLSTYISELGKGAYVRLNDYHSIVIGDITSEGFYVYEANYDNQCTVKYKYYTYGVYAKLSYSSITESVTHNFNNYTKVDTTYHKVDCSSSGCNGYIYEKHSFTLNKNGKFVCSGCGYISTVTPGVMSIEDNDL